MTLGLECKAGPSRLTGPLAVLRAVFSVPSPFRSFAVRSEELVHASAARAPWPQVQVVHTGFMDSAAQQALSSLGLSRMNVAAFSDITYAHVTAAELAAAALGVSDLVGQIAAALRTTGILGEVLDDYRRAVAARIDFLAAQGAGFHNDVSGHWTRCLFWNLALQVSDVEFVMPHAGIRVALAPGDLIVFDQTMAHGLCRPRDLGQAVAASFAPGADAQQIFLSGEALLTDEQWAALGSPWLPVEEHAAALELMAAEFDERTGTLQRPRTLAACMRRSTRYVDDGTMPSS